MLKNFLLSLAAIAIVAAATTTKAGQPLDHLTWDKWGIDIYQVGYTTQVPSTLSTTEADEGSVFVRVNFMVKNLDSTSHPFAPQLKMKLLWSGREYDGRDIDPGWSTLDSVEPSVTKKRAIYFEIPEEAKGQNVVIRFHDDGFFGLGASETQEASINFGGQKSDPTPASTPVSTTAVVSNPAPNPSPALPNSPPVADVAPLSDETATAAFNALQDRFHRPHARLVVYQAATDSYRWIGPRLHKLMSISRKDFNEQIYKDYAATTGAGKSISQQ